MARKEIVVKELEFMLKVMDEISTEHRIYIDASSGGDGYLSIYVSAHGKSGKGETVFNPSVEDIQRLVDTYAV